MSVAAGKGSKAIALTCVGVMKVFPASEETRSWKVLLGMRDPKGHAALRAVTIEVPKGEFVAVLGNNGAGKSTLLRVLAGVYQPTSGTVHREGRTTGIFELGGLGNRHLTGRQYARRALVLQEAPQDRIDELIAAIREFSELEGAFERSIFTYSAGMAARLYFAAATALESDVYLIDEMLSVGDEHFRAKCEQRLRERLSGGAAGVLVTHDWVAALALTRSAYLLQAGEVAKSGATDDVVVSYLNLPRPNSPVACFGTPMPTRFYMAPGVGGEIEFPIVVSQAAFVALGCSIERLRPGLSWEILQLQNNVLLAETPGRYSVKLAFADFPIAPGTYSLNLSLTAYKPEGREGEQTVGLDARGWTFGNGLTLEVPGDEHPAIIRPNLTWDLRANG